MQGHHVGGCQELLERDSAVNGRRARPVAHDHPHAERLGGLGHRAPQLSPTDDTEGAPRELSDGIGELVEFSAGPGSIDGQSVPAGEMLRETQDQGPDVLRHRGRAITADVAHRDTELLRRLEIDVIGAGGGQYDQLQVGRRTELGARQFHLVEKHDVRRADTLGNLRLLGEVAIADRSHDFVDRRRVEAAVAVADGFVIQEYGTHSATMPA